MSQVLVSGLINIETTLRVEGFPIGYSPVRYPFSGVNSTVSGVGYNVAKALHTLGDSVHLLAIVGRDFAANVVRQTMAAVGLTDQYVVAGVEQTAQSVILYDPSGRRQINVDLKNLQETAYPQDRFRQALEGCTLAALCNINFSRPFLHQARQAGIPIATDVHTISDLDDAYNRDFMEAADILFMSDESLPCPPEEWAQRVHARYNNEIIVIGLGHAGALLAVRSDRRVQHFPAVQTRPVVNTIGAGDALFSAFIHFYHKARDPYEALRKAIVFASWKIGASGAAEGFLTPEALDALIPSSGYTHIMKTTT